LIGHNVPFSLFIKGIYDLADIAPA